jgi:hypothetical protein
MCAPYRARADLATETARRRPEVASHLDLSVRWLTSDSGENGCRYLVGIPVGIASVRV